MLQRSRRAGARYATREHLLRGPAAQVALAAVRRDEREAHARRHAMAAPLDELRHDRAGAAALPQRKFPDVQFT